MTLTVLMLLQPLKLQELHLTTLEHAPKKRERLLKRRNRLNLLVSKKIWHLLKLAKKKRKRLNSLMSKKIWHLLKLAKKKIKNLAYGSSTASPKRSGLPKSNSTARHSR